MKKLLLITITMIAQLGAMAQWTVFPGSANEISCGSATEFAALGGTAIYRYNFGTSAYVQMTSNTYTLNGLAMGSDGTLIAKSTNTLSANSNLRKFLSLPATANNHGAFPGILTNNISALDQNYHIGCTGGNVVNNIYHYTGGAWAVLPGSTGVAAKKVVVGAGTTIYAMNWSASGNNVIVYSGGIWTPLTNSTLNVTDISVGDAGKVLAVSGGQLYYRTGGAWSLDQTAPSNIIRVSAASDGTVMLLLSNGGILKNTWVTINCGASVPLPVNTTASQNLTICSGQSTTLIATGTGTLNWTGPSSATGTTLVTPSLTTTATYSITNTVAGCTSLPTVVTVTVNSLTPPLFSGPSSISICSGTSTSLTASGTGTISWFASPTSTTALTTGTVYTTPTLTSNTSYYISATTNGCESTRAVKTITITPLPAQPVNLSSTIGLQNSGCQGYVAEFYVGTNCNWYTSATGGTSFLNSNVYSIPNLTTTTTYYVDRTVNGCTSAPRVALVATVIPMPSVLNQTVQNLTCNGSGNGSISLTLNNPSSFVYDWTPNVSTTYSATSLAAGIYTVQISSGAGLCVTTQTYNVTQPSAYNVPVNIIGGNILNFNDSYVGGTTFQWLDCNNGNAPISGAVNAQFTPTVSGSYALVVTDNCASTSTCTSILITGIKENSLLNNITLQPNPASTYITLSNVVEGTSVNVMDVTGKVVISSSVIDGEKTMTIETSNLSNGVYMIQLKNNGAVAHKKLIISK
jgi:hypothetical protein